jgi:oligosaccharyl transferase (archaeosortase A-associated)
MLYIQNLLHNIVTAHENIRAKLPSKARFGIIAFLAVISFIILIFKAEWLMANMIALLPVFYVAAVLAVGFKRALYGTAIFLFFCFTLWLRVGPPHQGVLGGSWVMYGENDGWYNMRLVENLVHHFPFRNTFDPYTLYPYGQNIPFAPFFDWFLALIIWVAGLGHPSAALIEKIGAYFPAVLGSLTIIPVYFIGKELFNRNAGLLAAGILAILPGEFLFRSLLGFTDHHAAEALFSTTTMLFFIMAIKRAQEARPTLSQIKHREWGSLKRPLLFALLTGFTLGIYLLSWIGGAVFVLIIFICLAVLYVLDHLKGKSTDYLLIIGIPIFIISLVMSSIFSSFLIYSDFMFVALVMGTLVICALSALSLIMSHRKIRRIYYPIAIVVLGFIGAGLLYLIDPSTFNSTVSRLSTFVPSSRLLTIMEAQPLLTGFNMSNLMDHRVWSYFTTGLFMVPTAFLIIIYSAVKREKLGKWLFLGCIGTVVLTVIIDQMTSMPWQIYLAEGLAIIVLYAYFEKSSTRMILLIWGFLTLLLLIAQTRFAYYFAINVALLSGYLLWRLPGWITQILSLLHWKEAQTEDEGKTRAEKRRAKAKEEQPTLRYLRPRYVSGALSIVIIFFLTVYPNLIYGTYNSNGWSPKNSATLFLPYHPYGPNGDWHEALTWMKDNTPDPFGNPDAYYDLYTAPASGESYDYPDSAYGVMSWWDYGHWITRMAHRIPNANPFQAGIGGPGPNGSIIPGASTFMTAQDEATASWVMDELDSKYVVIDYETAWPKYHTMITWSGKNQSDFYDYWYYDENNYLRTYNNPNPEQSPSAIFFYPAYYQSMCASWAISYDVKTDENGEEYKVLTGLANEGQPFTTYEEALSFINSNPGYKIVGWPEWIPALNNIFPVRSPIPLEALKEYIKIHSSPSVMPWGDQTTSYVEIYEYTGYEK